MDVFSIAQVLPSVKRWEKYKPVKNSIRFSLLFDFLVNIVKIISHQIEIYFLKIYVALPEAVKKQLAMDTSFDPYWQIMTNALDDMTLGYLHDLYFDQYYEDQISLK